MNSVTPQKVLILTAGYGEGHNGAARGLDEALRGHAECRIVDVCQESLPKVFRWTRALYLWVISCAPLLWKRLYDITDRVDMSKSGAGLLFSVEKRITDILDDWHPDVVISTYMVYPYMLDRIARRTGREIPYITVVTDSIVINKSWLCSQSDCWCVTDSWTKSVMEKRGVPGEKIRVTGFPVSPTLSENDFSNILQWQPGQPFHVLYFAQGSPRKAAFDLEALFAAGDDVRVTCILGKRFRQVYPYVKDLRAKYGSRLVIRGWTKKIPMYLAAHHLVVGKAGGATVHEVLAAKRPMLVHYLLPGQEEGNCELLGYLNGGEYIPDSAGLTAALIRLMADGGRLWRDGREALEKANMTGGAREIAEFALKLAEERSK